MQDTRIKIHKINSGYKQDYGYHEWVINYVVRLDGIPTIKVFDPEYPINDYLAWFRDGEWVVDLD